MSSSSSSSAATSPGKWRFSWEGSTHIPTLRLYLFNPEIHPANRCKNLTASLDVVKFLLIVNWIEDAENEMEGSSTFSLAIPIPRVLIDPGSSVDIKASHDHFEVKLVLLLPIDHPLVSNLDSILQQENKPLVQSSHKSKELALISEIDALSSTGGVHFYCKSCSTKLTKEPLSSFVEMPSTNWRDVADNWFGTCCCSFGGISEKLVNQYSNSYTLSKGKCLLDDICVIVCKDDLDGYTFPELLDGNKKSNSGPEHSVKYFSRDFLARANSLGKNDARFRHADDGIVNSCEALHNSFPLEEFSSDPCNNKVASSNACSEFMSGQCENSLSHEPLLKDHNHCCMNETNGASDPTHEDSECFKSIASKSPKYTESCVVHPNPYNLQMGSIGDGFMIRASYYSNKIEWVEFLCPKCSSFLGRYPCSLNDLSPMDRGIRLSKCYISTSNPAGQLGDIFRDYSLQRAFVNRLMENASDELSFRTVVRDLRTTIPVLQIVLLNQKVWLHTGYILHTDNRASRSFPETIEMHPVVKVLFSGCGAMEETESRKMEEWAIKKQADEVYMMRTEIDELIKLLKVAQETLPFSCSTLQQLSFSFLEL